MGDSFFEAVGDTRVCRFLRFLLYCQRLKVANALKAAKRALSETSPEDLSRRVDSGDKDQRDGKD